MTGSTNEWIKFFSEAGIPSKYAAKYATIFQDHRIQKNMLKDLNKEILYDMGIKTMGDVIAIIRQAKKVDEEDPGVKVLGSEKDTSPLSNLFSKAKVVRSTSKEETDKTVGISSSLAKRLGGSSLTQASSTIPVIKRTVVQVDDNEGIKKRISASGPLSSDRGIKFAAGTSGGSSSVFDRLGVTATTPIKPSATSTLTSGSALRRNGGEIALTTASVASFQQAIKATATVKPLKASSTSSLSARFSASSSSPYSIKDRLGGVAAQQQKVIQQESSSSHMSPLMKLIASNNSNQETQSKVLPLKKSIFDRLGS
jgi:hypothetical protein